MELEVNIDNGDASCDGQDDDVTAQNLLKWKGERRLKLDHCWAQTYESNFCLTVNLTIQVVASNVLFIELKPREIGKGNQGNT